jgi:molybdate transport system substrate-binding protein
MGPGRGVAAALLALLLVVAGCGGDARAGGQQVVRVAAAASLQYALAELIDDFRAAHPEVRVEVSYGSSGSLQQQIVNGAPFDLFLAADDIYPARVVDAGLAERADLFRYAQGRLVVWAAADSPVDPAAGLAAVDNARRIAIANPAHAPYGQAAQQALRAAGRYEQVADRLVLGDSVAQAAEFVASGNADVGIVAMSQVLAPALAGVGNWSEVPPELFDPLDHAGVLLSRDQGAGAEPARRLRDHLRSPAGAEVLNRYGFTVPAD